MRSFSCLSLVLATMTAAAASPGPRISPAQAPGHRGQLVTLVGSVGAVETRAHEIALLVGRVPVLVSDSALPRFGTGLKKLQGHRIEATGFLTTVGRPLALTLTDPDLLLVDPPSPEIRNLEAGLLGAELQLAYVAGRLPPASLRLITYGPSYRPEPIPLFASQTTVLARRGVPDLYEWTAEGPVLHYGFERWQFDYHGQLLRVSGP